MKAYHNTAVLKFDDDTTGNAASGVPVTVKINSSQLNATIFDVDGVGIANPLTTDDNGNYAFKAADNIYDIIVSEGTANEVKLEKVEIAEIPVIPVLINDLSQTYDFNTASLMASDDNVFPDDKKINISGYISEEDTGSGTWIKKAGLSDNGLDILNLTGGGHAELRKGAILTATQFGDITTNAKNIIERMVTVGNNLYLPSGEYDAAALDVITVNSKVVIHGDTPAYDPITDTKTGTWINGVLSSSGAKSIAMFDVGIDTRLTATNEGVVFSDAAQYLDSVFIDRVIVIAKPASNHCMLIENTKRVDVGTVICYGGIQGLAIKSEVFNIGSIFAFDQTTWGCTVRYSPGAPASNGYIGFVYCGTVNNAKGGGVICMNDQEGATLKNINFGKIIIDQGNAGFFITNGGNTVDAENITIDDIYIEGVSDFAIQTFGKPNGFKIGRAHLKDCTGSIYNNAGVPQDHEYNNVTLENTGVPALLSGSNHKLRGWSVKGGVIPTVFVQNESTDLQYFDFDARTGAVINQSGGTIYGGGGAGQVGELIFPANGNIPASKYVSGLKYQSSNAAVTQNTSFTVFTYPANFAYSSVEVFVTMASIAGNHMQHVSISGQTESVISASASATAVFTVEVVGDFLQVKYINAVTGDVDINVALTGIYRTA